MLIAIDGKLNKLITQTDKNAFKHLIIIFINATIVVAFCPPAFEIVAWFC